MRVSQNWNHHIRPLELAKEISGGAPLQLIARDLEMLSFREADSACLINIKLI